MTETVTRIELVNQEKFVMVIVIRKKKKKGNFHLFFYSKDYTCTP